MINWERVQDFLLLYLIDRGMLDDYDVPITLRDTLDQFYSRLGRSWKQIAEITDGYVSCVTLKEKARQLGIKIRSRGGSNYTKRQTCKICRLEYNTLTNKELGRKYKVCRQTIIKVAKEKGWPLKRAGRPKVVSLQDEVCDTYQEYH